MSAPSEDSPGLTHLDEEGAARMVDVGEKAVTYRVARAACSLEMRPETRDLLLSGGGPKGEALQVARIAGIMGAKKTPELIPLCHPLPLTKVKIHFESVEEGIGIVCEARCSGRTGVEMEAMTGATVAGLTLYDMAKAVEKEMQLSRVRLLEKQGGRSGHWIREGETSG